MSKANEKKPDGRRISKKLKPRQRKFIANYTDPTKETFGNGTRSAIAAGYTDKAPAEAAHQLLRNTKVRDEIELVMARVGITEEMALTQLKEGLAAVQVRVFCQDGKLIYSQELPDNQERRLSAVEVLKLLGRYPTNRTVERLELLRIQNTLIVVPAVEPARDRRERPVRQLTD
jgi:hypothetical protein